MFNILTRIISGAVIVIITAFVVVCATVFKLPIVLTAFLAFAAAMAVYEIFNNTGLIKNKAIIITGIIYAAVVQFVYSYIPQFAFYFSLIYGFLAIVIFGYTQKQFSYKRVLYTVFLPVLISFCFNCIQTVLNTGLMHLILMLNFSSICDCGAYFTGVTIGKHKLAPKISPKKTIEGAIGGIILSCLVTIIIIGIFNINTRVLGLIAITPVLCVAGMAGDLLASYVKRRVGIKDYGKIIPGHGGIMDRFDSILLIAPVYVILLSILGVA
ncbi:MAG: phosphatidate cytidylyltransferase [Clostridia bacterium]|nr:phosphatidate cytidylyltransferase [Clostridia bacterium]